MATFQTLQTTANNLSLFLNIFFSLGAFWQHFQLQQRAVSYKLCKMYSYFQYLEFNLVLLPVAFFFYKQDKIFKRSFVLDFQKSSNICLLRIEEKNIISVKLSMC